jgi:hypothetical protein
MLRTEKSKPYQSFILGSPIWRQTDLSLLPMSPSRISSSARPRFSRRIFEHRCWAQSAAEKHWNVTEGASPSDALPDALGYGRGAFSGPVALLGPAEIAESSSAVARSLPAPVGFSIGAAICASSRDTACWSGTDHAMPTASRQKASRSALLFLFFHKRLCGGVQTLGPYCQSRSGDSRTSVKMQDVEIVPISLGLGRVPVQDLARLGNTLVVMMN